MASVDTDTREYRAQRRAVLRRYRERMRDNGMEQISVWVPVHMIPHIQDEARALREAHRQ